MRNFVKDFIKCFETTNRVYLKDGRKKPTTIPYVWIQVLTIDIQRHSGLWSISNIIVWNTFVLAIVLRSRHIFDGVLTVIAVFDESAIQIEPVQR